VRFFLSRQFLPLAAGAALGAAAAGVYAKLTPPIYQCSVMAALDRPHVEVPSSTNEDQKNRWVWVRDGLALQQDLVSDVFLTELIAGTPPLAARFDQFASEAAHGISQTDLRLAFAEKLRREIQVDYTGGDANGFIITVRDADPVTARRIAEASLDQLRKLALDAVADEYRRVHTALNGRPEEKAIESARLARAAFAEKALRTLREPYTPLRPVWPRRGLLVFLGAFLGALAGWGWQLLRESARR
jgi:uncharacterized protein involved in exopolysaccharide biosynthesis